MRSVWRDHEKNARLWEKYEKPQVITFAFVVRANYSEKNKKSQEVKKSICEKLTNTFS